MTFGHDSTTDDVLSGVDLTGRHVVVTGASTGLGEETVRALAAHGATVTMAVRDLARGNAAADRVRAAVPNAELRSVTLDLASLSSVRMCADQLLAKGEAIDVLINNAGVMACPFGLTEDGFETQFGTNHLGHFLLSTNLAPLLTMRPGSRLVSLSSRGHNFANVDLEDWNFSQTQYQPFTAYGRAKTANALFAVGFHQRFAAQGVHAFSVHPGGIRTELGRHLTPETLQVMADRMGDLTKVQWKSIPQGAATSVWAATAPELVDHGGAYLEDCHVATMNDDPMSRDGVRPYAVDLENANALWELSERLVSQR